MTVSAPASHPVPAALSALVHQLGGEACVLPVPAAEAGLYEVGALGGLPVWGAAGSARDAARFARRLARAGRPGLLFIDDLSSGLRAATVTLQPVRLVTMPRDGSDPLPLRRLIRALSTPASSGLERALAMAEALDVDAAGRRTFRLLHQLLRRAAEALPRPAPFATRSGWVLTQLTRLLFLRFVEAEGWLDGDPAFLTKAVDRCLHSRRDPARHLLHPLFFGTLNRPEGARSRLARSFGRIPFLNGGLFEPHELERSHAWNLPTALWRDIFESLIGQVEVTLDAEAEDGRVTPELLGRVFEGTMDPEARHREGTFFTPPALVRAMVRAGVVAHLARGGPASEERLDATLDDPDPALRRRLLSLRVLDPSVGSGAFLVGALELLHGPGPRQSARVRHLVTRQLFGVDQHPGAVRLCELRLWLEVLRSLRGRSIAAVPPLPNLDSTIRAGDTLLDPLAGRGAQFLHRRDLARSHRALTQAHGRSKRDALAAIQRGERDAFLAGISGRLRDAETAIAECLAAWREPSLFGHAHRPSALERRRLRQLREQRAALRRELRRLRRDELAAPFALEVAFAPLLGARHGFDLVIGNPPWVRAEQLAPQTRRQLAERFRWWRGGQGPSWRHAPDLSVAFLERSTELLAEGGTMALLVPRKLTTVGYAERCRAELVRRTTIHSVADLADDPRAGFEATTYPLALVLSRVSPSSDHQVRLGLRHDAPRCLQQDWTVSPRWELVPQALQRIVQRVARDFPPLAESVVPQLGIKTGANTAFLDPPATLLPWTRPAVRGRDVRPFRIRSQSRLLWPADAVGTPWPQLTPDVARHLAPFESRLRARADLQDDRWWRLFRTAAAGQRHRVVWRDLAPRLEAAVLEQRDAVPLNTCYVVSLPSRPGAHALAGWLNAAPVRILVRLAAEPAAGGCARFGARAVGTAPLPPDVLSDPELVALGERASRGESVQAGLDAWVAARLGLNGEELAALAGLAAHRR